MSWKTYLQKYPKSIMEDEKSLVILSWLELAGLTTEEDCAESLNISYSDLKKIFLRLYKNNLISYSKHCVHVSENGKNIIDRLGLDKEIVAEVIDSLELPKKEKIAVEYILHKYRSESFRQYLDTFCSIRVFDSLKTINYHGEVTNIDWLNCKRSIVLRDLKMWFENSSVTLSTKELPQAELIYYLTYDTNKKNLNSYNTNTFHIASKNISFCEYNILNNNIEKLLSEDKTSSINNLTLLFYFQKQNSREDWFDTFVSQFSNNWTSSMKNNDVYYKLLKSNNKKNNNEKLWWINSFNNKEENLENNVDFLTILNSSHSIEDFSNKLGLPADSCLGILQRINEKSSKLLAATKSSKD